MSESAASSLDHESSVKRPLTRVPIWVPISAFVGTSLALVIPFLMLRKQRAILQVAMRENSVPPRRVVPGSAPLLRRSASASLPSSNASTSVVNIFSSDSDRASLNMMSAMSHMSASSAVLAAKAFAVATGIVAVGAVALVLGVKEVLGVKNAREFGNKMRVLLSTTIIPSLPPAIHRPSQSEKERRGALQVAPFGVQDNWRSEEAEKRLQHAYQEGGLALWGQVALRELEAEARVERERLRDMEREGQDQRS